MFLLYRLRPRLSVTLSLVKIFSLLVLAFSSYSADPSSHIFERADDVILMGSAVPIRKKSLVMLTNTARNSIGSVLYSKPVRMKNNSTGSSFSTEFLFYIAPPPVGPNGDGLAFMMISSRSLEFGNPGGYLGLPNNTVRFVALEFDTHVDRQFHDPDGNHIGLDMNSVCSVWSRPAGYWNPGNELQTIELASGRIIHVWIDYDQPKTQLNVTLMYAGYTKPKRPLVAMDIDLSDNMEEEMYVGFTAATGESVEQHYVLAWSFSNNGPAPSLIPSPNFKPKPGAFHQPRATNSTSSSRPTEAPWENDDAIEHRRSVTIRFAILGFTEGVLLVFAIQLAVVWMWLKRQHREDAVEKWELEFWPHRFPFKELNVATNGFHEKHYLGEGGFGRVYRGVLPGCGHEIAVKCITQEFIEGMKGFVAEVTSMGRLQHRNLVQLRGWCRRNKQLFIVYDFMPNGSLDKFIFGNPKGVLRWSQRYIILKGVAAGLLYLHEQWEKRVVHRDIKSCNVLLDSEMNGRLGDFGLAKLYEHSENPQNPATTHVVGTLGYIAPEIIQTGKATPSSDVFSFGALMLEVACGRIPVDPSKPTEEVILVDYALELFLKDRLLELADPRLEGEYDRQEMLRVLKLGLFCSHPEVDYRPGVRLVSQILEEEAPLPDMDMASFNASVTTPLGLRVPDSGSLVLFAGFKAPEEEERRRKEGSKTRHISSSDHSIRSAILGQMLESAGDKSFAFRAS